MAAGGAESASKSTELVDASVSCTSGHDAAAMKPGHCKLWRQEIC